MSDFCKSRSLQLSLPTTRSNDFFKSAVIVLSAVASVDTAAAKHIGTTGRATTSPFPDPLFLKCNFGGHTGIDRIGQNRNRTEVRRPLRRRREDNYKNMCCYPRGPSQSVFGNSSIFEMATATWRGLPFAALTALAMPSEPAKLSDTQSLSMRSGMVGKFFTFCTPFSST